MASLNLEGISKRFGQIPALRDVSLAVADGEFCVLLGPSGCGKSTLLNIVAGLDRQDRGSVLMDGRRVDTLEPRERDVAVVFQNYALYPHMSVAQNLSFGLRMRKTPKADIQKRVLETARLLGIEQLLERKPRQLSGGQRQRVAMGRALVRRPKLFLLDEPLSNLDAQLRLNVRLELKRLHRQLESTMLYVTHDQVEAMTLGDKVVVMQGGQVRQIGKPETIYDRPSDTFVATFIGAPMMNLFKGQIVRRNGHLTFSCRDFSLALGNLSPDLLGKTVQIGVRPEDVVVQTNGKANLHAQVEMSSNVGAEKYLHARLGKDLMTLRVPKETAIPVGQVVAVFVDPGKLHVFYEGKRV
jgi:ABC-type sugar transport system ATPase subunit